MNIAIIGAGMAGLSCATRLSAEGHAVTVFDKGRGPGGRMATRRTEVNGETLHFDHGAQYFTAHDDGFAREVAEWEANGVVARWPAAGEGACVGVPGMNAPIKAMASALNVHFGRRVEAVEKAGDGWRLGGDGIPEGSFDAVLVAVPAEQVSPLLAGHAPAMAKLAEQTVANPCWTLMVAFESALDHADTTRDAGAIDWAARNSAKPGRGVGECWVVQASPAWSRAHLEEKASAIIPLLLNELQAVIGVELPEPRHAAAHRWRYAKSGSAGDGAVWDKAARLGICGDWLIGPCVEDAYVSGQKLAGKVLSDG